MPLPADPAAPLNLTFMVDVSGSMPTPDKLALAQKAMNLIIDQLRPQDRAAVTYARFGTAVWPTPGAQKLKLRCAVTALNAGGSTAGAQVWSTPTSRPRPNFGADKVNRILMFTDGDFNVGVTEPATGGLCRRQAQDRHLSVGLRLRARQLQDDTMMQTIAQAGNGTAAYVDT
jgi:Ca-activated chloride channel family protein